MEDGPSPVGDDLEVIRLRLIDPALAAAHGRLKRERKEALRRAKEEHQRQRMYFWRGGRTDKLPELEARYERACAQIEAEFAEKIKELLAGVVRPPDPPS